MNDDNQIAFTTEISVDRVQRILGEGLIALILKLDSGKTLGLGLTEQDASALLLRLTDALRSDDKGPQAERTLHLDPLSGKPTALPAAAFSLHFQGDQAILVVQTQDGLQIPFSCAASALVKLAVALNAKGPAGEDC